MTQLQILGETLLPLLFVPASLAVVSFVLDRIFPPPPPPFA